MSQANDRALRFYHEVLELEHLHYGFWNPEDDLTLENLRKAQQRFEDFLVDNIPQQVQTILDVGCGTSAMTRRLLASGKEVEGLSPDEHQKDIFTSELNVPFYHSTFERFTPSKQYDCLIMSESAQYIPYQQLFQNAKASLKPGGYLMICDYFITDDASGLFAKSGHNINKFMQEAEKTGFNTAKEEDVTDRVLKTLDLSMNLVNRTRIALDILTEKIRTKHPGLTKLVAWLMRKKIQKTEAQLDLLDSAKFKKYKRYQFVLFQKPS